jgi:flagellar protein FlaJ
LRLTYWVIKKFPQIVIMVKKARLKYDPEEFVKKAITMSIFITIAFSVLIFFAFDKMGVSHLYTLFVAFLIMGFTFIFIIYSPLAKIRRREREINEEVLFAGRYLVVKLESGTPLFNALIDATSGYGISSKYFREIVDDINTGTPIEDALENAREYNCSEKFKLILSELITTLKTGADVTSSLRDVIQQITNEQIIEIKEYSKKLNGYVMMYLIIAVIVPSLGMTMFTVMSGFLSLQITPGAITALLLLQFFIQFMFISLFKQIRPMVNI